MLLALNIYQILSCCISMVIFTRSLVNVSTQKMNPELYFVSILLLMLPVFIIYSNVHLIYSKRKREIHLAIKQWFNYLQIFQLSIFGYAYYLIVGLDFTPSIFDVDKINFKIQSYFFTERFNLSYHAGDSSIIAGINLVPLVCAIVLEKGGIKQFSKT